MERGEDIEEVNLRKKVRLSNGTSGRRSESVFDFSGDIQGKLHFTCIDDIPGVSTRKALMKRRSLPLKFAEQQQQQDTVELSLEGLQSSGQCAVTEGQQQVLLAGDVASEALISQGASSISEQLELADEKLAQHGVLDRVFKIAPLKLQVSGENKVGPCPAVEAAMSQGRQPFEVVLRGGTPWGFALNGGTGTELPVYISKVSVSCV